MGLSMLCIKFFEPQSSALLSIATINIMVPGVSHKVNYTNKTSITTIPAVKVSTASSTRKMDGKRNLYTSRLH